MILYVCVVLFQTTITKALKVNSFHFNWFITLGEPFEFTQVWKVFGNTCTFSLVAGILIFRVSHFQTPRIVHRGFYSLKNVSWQQSKKFKISITLAWLSVHSLTCVVFNRLTFDLITETDMIIVCAYVSINQREQIEIVA